jgi:hypothetical protein
MISAETVQVRFLPSEPVTSLRHRLGEVVHAAGRGADRRAVGEGGTDLTELAPEFYDRALTAAEVMELSGNTAGIAKATDPALKVDAIIDNADSRITLPMKERCGSRRPRRRSTGRASTWTGRCSRC